MGAVDADHRHGGERCELNRDPHHADIIGDQREIHGEHQGLVHRVIESHIDWRQPADLDLVVDIARAEHAGGEAHEGGEHDEDLVEVVQQQIGTGFRGHNKQRQRRDEGCERRENVEPRCQTIARKYRQHEGRNGRNQQDAGERVDHHRRSPRNRSSSCKSTLSKRSRIRKRKMPITMKAISTENATEISTTSGMPLAPVAASTRPFSSDMKPTICVTALRRVIIIRRPKRMTASANARSSRASRLTVWPTGSTSRIDSATRPKPVSIVGPAPITSSIWRWMPSRRTIRCSAVGITKPFRTSAITAVIRRCGASWM